MRPAAVGDRWGFRALSVRQPWATLLARGIKTVENRTWPTKGLTGWVVIHASSGAYDTDGALWIAKRFPHLADLVDPAQRERHHRGVLLGHARLIGCLRSVWDSVTDYRAAAGREGDVQAAIGSPWFVGPYGHVFADACPWEQRHFAPFKGRLGYFSVPAVEVPVKYQIMMEG